MASELRSEWKLNQPVWILGLNPGYFESWVSPDQALARIGTTGAVMVVVPSTWLTERSEE